MTPRVNARFSNGYKRLIRESDGLIHGNGCDRCTEQGQRSVTIARPCCSPSEEAITGIDRTAVAVAIGLAIALPLLAFSVPALPALALGLVAGYAADRIVKPWLFQRLGAGPP